MGHGRKLELTPTPLGHERRGSCLHIPHHCHDRAYAALILSGSYEESGSRGRFCVGPGDVLLHDAFDAHLDRFQSSGAQIFSLVMEGWPAQTSVAHVADPDAIIRAAERNVIDATVLLLAELRRKPLVYYDWPDILANDLLGDPNCRLDAWARKRSLAPATVSRGFRRVFGVTPAAFRLGVRARQAFRMIRGTDLSFATIAATAGFADQAHMSRAIRMLTGSAAGRWRGSNSFKTPGAPYA